jgi:DNA-binding PadR family transcriptional regulator
MSFLQPCLLFMLQGGSAHGYNLLNRLDEFGFNLERLDPSLVYRALRELEDSGWVSSNWDEDSQGPQRRVYQILPEGEGRLADWITDLRRTRDDINRLVSAYDKKRTQNIAKEDR